LVGKKREQDKPERETTKKRSRKAKETKGPKKKGNLDREFPPDQYKEYFKVAPLGWKKRQGSQSTTRKTDKSAMVKGVEIGKTPNKGKKKKTQSGKGFKGASV